MPDEDKENPNPKKGFSPGFFLMLMGLVLALLAYQNYTSLPTAKVSFSHQLEHLVNLDLLDPQDSRKVAVNDSLVSYSGQFRATLPEDSKQRYQFLELLYQRNQLREKRAMLFSEQPKLQKEARRAALRFLELSALSIPAKGFVVVDGSFEDGSTSASIVLFEKDLQKESLISLRDVEEGYILARQLKGAAQQSELSSLRENLSALIASFMAPSTGLGLESAKVSLRQADTLLRSIQGDTPSVEERLTTYNQVIQLLQRMVAQVAILKDHGHLQDLRQVRSYLLNLKQQKETTALLDKNQLQLDKAKGAVQDQLWYFGNQKLTTRQLENVDSEAYSAWFQQAKGAMDHFEENKGLTFSTPNEKRNLVIEENFRSEEPAPNYIGYLFTLMPVILLLSLLYFVFSRQMKGGGQSPLNFGKSTAKMLDASNVQITFKDVAGVDEAKEELVEVVDFLADPHKFTSIGAKIPKGILLIGPPGTGKTLLAKAVAGEAKRPFFSISGSDFVEMFVGVGASRIRDLFEQAKKQSPCIIFIDEIDAVGRHRGVGLGGGNDEREQTLNQLLVELDGIHSNVNVILIAATNRPDVLDAALLRPGRFDRHVYVPFPDIKGRFQIFLVHTRKIKLEEGVDLMQLAKQTPGSSGADIANIVNEAAIYAARSGRVTVAMSDLEMAIDKVRYGKNRRLELEFEERKATAYHEAGHTVTAVLLKEVDEVEKVTITPKARSLGSTQFTPKERYSYWKNYLLDKLVVLMGGRVAEEIFLHDLSSGAQQDIEQATGIARKMVCRWGMSESVGAIALVGEEDEQNRQYGSSDRSYSEETARLVDTEVQKLLVAANHKARELLESSRDKVEVMVAALLEFETLDREDIFAIMDGKFDSGVKRQKIDESLKLAAPKGPPPFSGKLPPSKGDDNPNMSKPVLS